MAKVRFACACGKGYQVDEQLSGKRVKCPNCQNVMTVPAAISSLPSELGTMPAVPPYSGGLAGNPPAAPGATDFGFPSRDGGNASPPVPGTAPNADGMAMEFLMDAPSMPKSNVDFSSPRPSSIRRVPTLSDAPDKKPSDFEARRPDGAKASTGAIVPIQPEKPKPAKKKKKETPYWKSVPRERPQGTYLQRAMPGIIKGGLMIAGGSIWLVAGWTFLHGTFVYAIVVICLGVVTLLKGLLFAESD